ARHPASCRCRVPGRPRSRPTEGRAYADEVRADEREAAELGATGVPFFVLDRTYGVSGAQPAEVFTQALTQAWGDRSPLTLLQEPGGAAEVCGPDGCAVPQN
ncbi:DsbA family protein, partial [Streptomyces sp. NPDC005568]|uniref:DsbA family oxidoreductase n=1 Tax=Streptomyces sp. NPDC005568 TaxID=3156887 RepID=UPI0033B30BA0